MNFYRVDFSSQSPWEVNASTSRLRGALKREIGWKIYEKYAIGIRIIQKNVRMQKISNSYKNMLRSVNNF